MNRKDFFNKCACTWDSGKNELDSHKIKTAVIPLLDLKNDDTVLDVACGTGIFIETLKEKYKNIKVTGIDFAQNMIDKAMKKFPDTDFIVTDVVSLPFENNTFNKVMCLNAFPHFEDKNKAVKEINRVLKKNGLFILAHTNSKLNIDTHHRNIGGLIAEDMLPCNETIRLMLNDNGFKNITFLDTEDIFIVKTTK